MTKYLMLFALLIGCGDSSVDGSFSGQVKFVETQNPIICSRWTHAEVSSGIMKDGQGSMSTSDYRFYIEDRSDIETLKSAAKTGQLVEITYSVARFRWCVDVNYVTGVKLID